MVFCTQLDAYPLTPRIRPEPHIHTDVEDPPLDAPNQLRLAVRIRLPMDPPGRPRGGRPGYVHLRDRRIKTRVFEIIGGEGASEEPTLIFVWLEGYEAAISNTLGLEFHELSGLCPRMW